MDFPVWSVTVLYLRELQKLKQYGVSVTLKGTLIQHFSQSGVVILTQPCIPDLHLIIPFDV